MMSFTESLETCLLRKYFTASGRATRAEYWWFQLFVFLLPLSLALLFSYSAYDAPEIAATIMIIVFILLAIPSICAGIRRLHDAGYAGYYILIGLIPYLGGLIYFIMMMLPSEGDNDYGPAHE